jgi:hypothetical protein
MTKMMMMMMINMMMIMKLLMMMMKMMNNMMMMKIMKMMMMMMMMKMISGDWRLLMAITGYNPGPDYIHHHQRLAPSGQQTCWCITIAGV